MPPLIFDDATLIPPLLALVANVNASKCLVAQYVHVMSKAVLQPDSASWTAFDNEHGLDVLLQRMEHEMNHLFGAWAGKPSVDPKTTKVDSIMSKPLITINHYLTRSDANEMMLRKKIKHIAVTEGSNVLGILTSKDMVT